MTSTTIKWRYIHILNGTFDFDFLSSVILTSPFDTRTIRSIFHQIQALNRCYFLTNSNTFYRTQIFKSIENTQFSTQINKILGFERIEWINYLSLEPKFLELRDFLFWNNFSTMNLKIILQIIFCSNFHHQQKKDKNIFSTKILKGTIWSI